MARAERNAMNNDDVSIQELTVRAIRQLSLVDLKNIHPDNIIPFVNWHAGRLLMGLDAYIASDDRKHALCEWPRDWWQAVRARWCPRWWLARHPVLMERREFVASEMVPHLNINVRHDPVAWIHAETFRDE